MNSLLNRKAPVKVSRVKEPVSNLLLDEADSANCLNEYYVNVAAQLTAKLPPTNTVYSPTPSDTPFVLRDLISCRRITETLKDFSPGKSSGCLNISSKLYLDAFEVLEEQLAFLMNLSIRTQTFPDAWKLSVVTPIPKKGYKTTPENTRPISLVHICSNIIEKIVNSIVMSHVYEHKI